MPRKKPQSEKRRCRVCGCTDDRPCPGGCEWVAPNLCHLCLATVKVTCCLPTWLNRALVELAPRLKIDRKQLIVRALAESVESLELEAHDD